MNIFAGNSLWQLVWQSDAVSKFVLLLLLGMSIACWAIFIGKLIIFHLKKRQFKDVNKKIHNAKNITQLRDIALTTKNTAPGHFLTKNLAFLSELTNGNLEQQIDDNKWELVERNIDNSIESVILHNEAYLPILSLSANVATLLGLFGTIWGLVHSFMRISETQVADITTVAPGIAEALITTLAGLVVAIPAMIMFNYLQTKMRALEHSLIILTDRMTYILQHNREG
jgi:biopolymer transport protein TolQ